MGKISEDEMMSKIKASQKKNEKLSDLTNILDTFTRVAATLFHGCLRDQRSDSDLCTEFEELVRVVNTDLDKLRARYRNSIPRIDLDANTTRWLTHSAALKEQNQ
jgi:hypothetical protein